MPRCARVLQFAAAVLTLIAMVAEYYLADRTMILVLAGLGTSGCGMLHYGICQTVNRARLKGIDDGITAYVARVNQRRHARLTVETRDRS
jgi:hypothetical protein